MNLFFAITKKIYKIKIVHQNTLQYFYKPENKISQYFSNLYPTCSLHVHTEFQLHRTKIGGLALKGGDFTPKPPRNGGLGVGRGEGVNIFLLYI